MAPKIILKGLPSLLKYPKNLTKPLRKTLFILSEEINLIANFK